MTVKTAAHKCSECESATNTFVIIGQDYINRPISTGRLVCLTCHQRIKGLRK